MARNRLEAIEKCAEWARNLHPQKKFPYLQDAIEFRPVAHDGGGIGVYAVRDIQKGERLIELASDYTDLKESHQLLAGESVELQTILQEIENKWEGYLNERNIQPGSPDLFSRTRGSILLKWEIRLAVLVFLLLAENDLKLVSSRGKGPLVKPITTAASYWSSFLETWPTDYSSNPLLWTEGEMKGIEGTPFHVWASRVRLDVEMLWTKCVWPVLRDTKVLGEAPSNHNTAEAGDPPEKTLFWKATAALRSRSHMQAPETNPFDLSLLMAGGTLDPKPTMMPLIDLVNGVPDEAAANTELLGVPVKPQMNLPARNILRAVSNIQAGEEILHCYGELDNASYFQRFGYIPIYSTTKLPILHNFDRLGLVIPPTIIPPDNDQFHWQELKKRGHTKERLTKSNNEFIGYGLLGMQEQMKTFRRQDPEEFRIDAIPQLQQLFTLSLAVNLLTDDRVGGQVEPYLFGKTVIDILDYNLQLIPPRGGMTNTADIAILKGPTTTTTTTTIPETTAACARVLTREILLQWRHAVRVQYSFFLTTERERKTKLPPILLDPQFKCNSCWASLPALKKCVRCKRIYYCSVECQKEDWREHKKTCKAVTT